MEDTSVQVSHQWSPTGCNIWPRAPRSDFNNGPGDNSNSDCTFAHRRLFEYDSNNGPSSGHSNLGQMEDTSVQVPTCGILMSSISGQGSRLDFNNCPWDNLNSGRILAHRRLF